MDKNRILIAFKDDEETTVFSGYLSGLGFEFTSVKDGARALEIAIHEVPSLIITDLDLPVINGQRIFQILRHNPHTSKIPFLFISSHMADIKGFRAGVDIFLLRPLNLEEMHGRIRQTLSLKSGANIGSKDIEGKLTHMSLADILQFLHLNKKEGELKITSGDLSGSVFVKEGLVYNAVLSGAEKEKALYRLLQWVDGRFEFIPKPVAVSRKIRSTTGSLIMEGMRQIDEFKKKNGEFPDGKAVIRARAGACDLPKGLQPVVYEIMQLLKAYSRAEDIVEHCSYPDYEVYNSLAGMIGRGMLEEVKAKRDSAPCEFLTPDQAISIREKIISRFTDMYNLSYGKIFLISTSGALASGFIKQCRHIPGFSVNTKPALSQLGLENPLGESAAIRLYGGMELMVFSIPAVRSMGPIWKAFSANLIGLILLWDGKGEKDIKELVNAKKDILSRRRVPAVHLFSQGAGAGDDEFYKKAFNLKTDEPVFRMDFNDTAMIQDVFYALFGNLLKEDYIAS